MKSPESHCIPGVFFLASPNQFSLATWTVWLPTACSTLQNENKVLRITIWDTGGDPAGLTEAQMQWDLTRLPWSDLKIAATLKIVKERIIGGGIPSPRMFCSHFIHTVTWCTFSMVSLKLWVICASNNFFSPPSCFCISSGFETATHTAAVETFCFQMSANQKTASLSSGSPVCGMSRFHSCAPYSTIVINHH